MSIRDELRDAKREVIQEELGKLAVETTAGGAAQPRQAIRRNRDDDGTFIGEPSRRNISVSLPVPCIKYLEAVAAAEKITRSEVLVRAVEFQAKLYDSYKPALDKIVVSRPYLAGWHDAVFYAIDSLDLDRKITAFDQRLTSVSHSLSLVSEKMLTLSTLQEYIRKLSDNAGQVLKSIQGFTDQFGIQRQLTEIKRELERLEDTVKNIKVAAPTAYASQVVKLEKLDRKATSNDVAPDESMDDIPADLITSVM